MGEYFYFTLSIILPLQTYVTNNLENYYVLKLLLVINLFHRISRTRKYSLSVKYHF